MSNIGIVGRTVCTFRKDTTVCIYRIEDHGQFTSLNNRTAIYSADPNMIFSGVTACAAEDVCVYCSF